MKEGIPNLFSLSQDYKFDRWYNLIRDRSDLKSVKEHIKKMWEFYYSKGLSDPHFMKEFPVHFCHRWWELEVAWFFFKQKFNLRNFTYGPDLICTKNNMTVYVEDVVSESGDQNSPDYPNAIFVHEGNVGEFKVASVDLKERERVELLRLRNSIESKANKYYQWIEKGQIDQKTPFVLAISSVMIPDMISDGDGLPSIIKAVYPVGHITLKLNPKNQKVVEQGRAYRPKVQKSSKSNIYTDIFLDNSSDTDYSCISGILYSSFSFRNTNYAKSPYHSFIFVHNYNSRNPIEIGFFDNVIDYWIENREDNFMIRNKGPQVSREKSNSDKAIEKLKEKCRPDR